jgi:hypothetical protein
MGKAHQYGLYLHAIVLFIGWPSQVAFMGNDLSQDSKKEKKKNVKAVGWISF